MLKNKKFLLASLLLASFLEAKTMLNGVAVLVNNEPITLYEIHKISKQNNVDLKQALDALIQQRLQESQIKRLNISASEFEINSKVKQVAEKNSLSVDEFFNALSLDGLSRKEYEEQIAKKIKAQKLYESIFKSKNAMPSQKEIRSYYEANKEKFTQATEFKVIIYISQNSDDLQAVMKSPLVVNENVKTDKKSLKADHLDKRTLFILNQTPIGKFTPILKTKNGFVSFLLSEKSNLKAINFDEASGLVANMLSSQKQKMVVKNYFEKLKSSADIVMIRKP